MAADLKQKGHYFQGPNNVWYYIEISMYNQILGQEPLYVPFFLVESLVIHETLFNWVTKAEIVFNNDFEIFLRGSPNNPLKSPYIDRTDGRNRINIRIYPVIVDIENGVISQDKQRDTDEQFPKEYYEINHDFVVSQVQDIPVGNNQTKKRMYILVDEKFQILKEKNLEWSSEYMASKNSNSDINLTDFECALNPTDVLKELLKIAATNNDTMPKIKVGFDENGSIDKPNIDLDKISDKWNSGDANNKVIFYKYANTNALDDIYYVLSHCISDDGYPVILDYGRSAKNKGWSLISFSQFFERATPEQIERLIIEDGLSQALDSENNDATGVDNNPPYIPRASDTAGTPTNNFTSIQASRITSYKYSPMMAMDDNRLKNKVLCFYNEHTGFFEMIKKENHIKNLITKLNDLANKGLYSFKNSIFEPQIILNVNQTKMKGQMTENKFALNGPYGLKNAPMMQMILDSVFLNQSISFQTLGLTMRTPGKFIFIDRVGAGDKNTFDDRFLGSWMITSVSHLFTQETYITEVVANKIDSFSSLGGVEDQNY